MNTELKKQLVAALSTMDLPVQRKNPTSEHCLDWLGKHLSDRNRDHSKFDDAYNLLRQMGVRRVNT